MNHLEEVRPTCISIDHCLCSVCTFNPPAPLRNEPSDLNTPNSMHLLLKLLPPAFPIMIEQTVIVERA